MHFTMYDFALGSRKKNSYILLGVEHKDKIDRILSLIWEHNMKKNITTRTRTNPLELEKKLPLELEQTG